MVVPSVDWKNQPQTLLDWVTVVVAMVLISIYVYQGWTTGGVYRYGIWILYLGWVLIYFTAYWQPILYLLMAFAVTAITVFLLLGGYWNQPLDQAALLLTTLFLLLLVYLSFHEEQTQ